ncbi:MAG: MFS transporter [Pseudomonadota bacterium]
MLTAIRSVASLLLGAAILVLGNGLLFILLPIRLGVEGISSEASGLVMSAYYAGFVGGALRSRELIGRVGHIRAFAAFAAVLCAVTLVYALWFGPISWTILRAVNGFCMAGLFATIESWLNERSSNATRGQILSLYMVTTYSASGTGQLLVNLSDVQSLTLYCVAALLLSISLVPVVLTRVAGPDLSGIAPLKLRELYRISPLGVVGCFGAGLLSGSFYGMGPIYAQAEKLSVFQVSLFMGAAIFGGLLLQWPIGRLSDRFDRRTVLLGVLIATTLVFTVNYSLSISGAAELTSLWLLLGLPALFGGGMAVIYPIAVAHAFDYVAKERMVAASSGLLLAWAIGATTGPLVASLLMGRLGAPVLLVYLAIIAGALALFVHYRMTRRAALPAREQAAFVPVTTTSAVAGKLDPRAGDSAAPATEQAAAAS